MRYAATIGAVLGFVVLFASGAATGDSGPVISDLKLIRNPNPAVPLAAICTFKTDRPAIARLTIDDGDYVNTVSPVESYVTEHRLIVLGLRPGRTNSVQVTVNDRAGESTTSEFLDITTDPLPEDFPPIELKISRPAKMEPGITLVPMFRWPTMLPDETYGLLLGLDAHGEVVWYFRWDHGLGEARRLANGNLIFQVGRDGLMMEIDMLGNIIHRWHSTGLPRDVPDESIPVETDTFHHDMDFLPNGNILMLSSEFRHVEDWPSGLSDPDAPPKPATVISDVLVEFKPDGTVVNEWKMFDILDPYRLGHGSLDTGFWGQIFKDVLEKPGRDWSHINSIVYDESDHSAIMSSFHLDFVMKLDLATSELVWILGNHEDWKEPWQKYLLKPVNENMLWNYHQHAAKLTPHGTITMYDNGTYRARPFQEKISIEDSFSRAVEFKIDEENMSVENVWSYGGPKDEIWFSPFLCDVDWLPETENILVTDGGRVRGRDGKPSASPIGGKHWARIFEVTHESPAEKVFEIVIDDDRGGWAVYRSQRVPSLYP